MGKATNNILNSKKQEFISKDAHKSLSTFQAELIAQLEKTDNFNKTVREVLDEIKYSIYKFDSDELENLREELRNYGSKRKYRNDVILFIKDLKITDDVIEKIKHSRLSEHEKGLYKYFLKYSTKLGEEIAEFLESSQEIINIFVVTGVSKFLNTKAGSSHTYKYVWFVEHLIPYSVEHQKMQNESLGFTSTKTCQDAYLLLENILNYFKGFNSNIGNEFRDIDETNYNRVIDFLSSEMCKMLEHKNIVIPIFIEERKPYLEEIEPFFKEYITLLKKQLNIKIEESKVVTNSKLLFVIMATDATQFEKVCDTIKISNNCKIIDIPSIDKTECEKWVNHRIEGFFKQNNNTFRTFIDCFNSTENYTPDCQSKEGLFEKIASETLEINNFSEFINRNNTFYD